MICLRAAYWSCSSFLWLNTWQSNWRVKGLGWRCVMRERHGNRAWANQSLGSTGRKQRRMKWCSDHFLISVSLRPTSLRWCWPACIFLPQLNFSTNAFLDTLRVCFHDHWPSPTASEFDVRKFSGGPSVALSISSLYGWSFHTSPSRTARDGSVQAWTVEADPRISPPLHPFSRRGEAEALLEELWAAEGKKPELCFNDLKTIN